MRSDPQNTPPVRWYGSLIVRAVLLCAVLLCCLLALFLVITRHYFREVVTEMESQARALGDNVVLEFEENPDVDLDALTNDLLEMYSSLDAVELDPHTQDAPFSSFAIEPGDDGALTKVARVPVTLGEHVFMLTISVRTRPQTEILNAFKNKYLATLAIVFVLTLGLMVYFIARILRPLRDLSRSCARIAEGDLQDVTVRHNYGEILALERVFNRMVASLREKEVVEANLRQSQRLSALGNLAAGVAHDVRNPLNAIKLLASHALDTLGGAPESKAAAKQLTTIRNEVNRLEEIMSGFLSLAKERELQPEPVRVDALLDECVRLVAKDAEMREVKLIAELRAGETVLTLDPKLWTRAIINVLINGMQACPKGGRVRLFSRLTGTHCEIEVRDDGPGLSDEAAERAFEPYFTTKPAGTGLGLSITRGIVEEHNGAISLSSAEGMGCQVLITMPLEGKPL